MDTVTAVALASSVGSVLQGWHGGAIAGALLYLKADFDLDGKPTIEGLIVASALLGAVMSTLCAGLLADWLGRRWALCVSATLYTIAGIVMVWSPDVPLLIVGRLLAGAAIGLASAICPLFISEASPAEVRGKLSTFPQLSGSFGMFLAYSLSFGLSLVAHPSWRSMLGVTLAPSLLFLALCFIYLPESPRWLVSKGEMIKAKKVLQRLRNKEDVAAELALLVEGLMSHEESMQEYVLAPVPDFMNSIDEDKCIEEDDKSVLMMGSEDDGVSWVATSVRNSEHLSGSGANLTKYIESHSSNVSIAPDAVVTFMRDLHEGSQSIDHSSIFENSGLFRDGFDEESSPYLGHSPPARTPYDIEGAIPTHHEEGSLTTPLLSATQSANQLEKPDRPFESFLTDGEGYGSRGNLHSWGSNRMGNGNFLNGHSGTVSPRTPRSLTSRSIKDGPGRLSYMSNNANEISTPKSLAESFTSSAIGGGWQLAWQWSHDEDGGSIKRVFLHPKDAASRGGSVHQSFCGGDQEIGLQVSALVGTPAQSVRNILGEEAVGPAILHPSNIALKGPAWSEIMEPAVLRALLVGCCLQLLQQLSGLNAVLYYTPQILKEAGAEVVLSKLGLDNDSSSLLASAVTGLLMLPCILVAVRLMDQLGRRQLLLTTLPVLSVSLIFLILAITFLSTGVLQASLSFIILVIFISTFVMGFGPIPNILCAEFFPTRVRGTCIGICAATMWISTVVITYAFPAMIAYVGLRGMLAVFAVVSLISWWFVYKKVPETKGIPLEVISEFFVLSAAKQHEYSRDENKGYDPTIVSSASREV